MVTSPSNNAANAQIITGDKALWILTIALLRRAGTTVTFHAASSLLGRPPCRPAQWSAVRCQPSRTPRKPAVAYTVSELRGMYLTSKNRLAEGRFGAMFKKLPAFAPSDDLLTNLAKTMVEDQTVPDDNHLNTSPRLFAGIHVHRAVHRPRHHVRHHAARSAAGGPRCNHQLPDAALRPRFGLRRGSGNEPQFYDPADRDKLLLATNDNGVLDVPRDGDGRAIIPDPRNDENLIIVQFHKAVAQFHNKIVDYARSQGMRREWVFETARRLTRWHYQWAVIHDFLPRFVGEELVGPNGTVYKEVAGKPPVINVRYYKPTNKDGRPFMPVEFAVAAYRFGHSLIRPFYIISQRWTAAASRSSARRAASTSTAAARSPPTWSWSGRTYFPDPSFPRPARRARSTRSCRCR